MSLHLAPPTRGLRVADWGLKCSPQWARPAQPTPCPAHLAVRVGSRREAEGDPQCPASSPNPSAHQMPGPSFLRARSSSCGKLPDPSSGQDPSLQGTCVGPHPPYFTVSAWHRGAHRPDRLSPPPACKSLTPGLASHRPHPACPGAPRVPGPGQEESHLRLGSVCAAESHRLLESHDRKGL